MTGPADEFAGIYKLLTSYGVRIAMAGDSDRTGA